MKTSFKISLFACTALAVTLLFNACRKDKESNNPIPTTLEYGKITGKVVTPHNHVVGAATISSGMYRTRSNKDGDFTLTVPAGTYELSIYTGSGHIFKTVLNVTVKANETLTLTTEETKLQQIKPLAYLRGDFDQIETIIIDSLGYSATMINVNDLGNLAYLQTFGALFLNCTPVNFLDSAKYVTMNDYLMSTGSIYASDWAVEYLTGNGQWRLSNSGFNNAGKNGSHAAGYSTMSTCLSPQVGGFIPDSSLCTSKSGPQTILHNAHINDPNLITLLGKDSLDIEYNLYSWEVISNVDVPFSTIIEMPFSSFGPLAVTCDLNGDKNDGGKIFYTTFHNHPQGYISQDIKLVLQYFILNL